MKLIRWLVWNIIYLLCPKSQELDAYLTMGNRCRWPWKKFQPSVYHNDDGKMWHIYLTEEGSYSVARQTMLVDVYIARESGNIVGFNVWDEELTKGKE